MRGTATASLRVAIPFAALLLSAAIVWAAAKVAHVNVWSPSTWQLGDVNTYEDIAVRGFTYEYAPDQAHLPNRNAVAWEDSAGWLPGMPWLIRPLLHLGISYAAAGIALSTACYLLTLELLWIGFLHAQCTSRNVSTLLLAAVFPGVVYQFSPYPVAIFCFLNLLCLHCLMRKRWLLAAAAGAAAAMVYPTGILLAIVAGTWALAAGRDQPPPRRLFRALAVVFTIAAGLGVVLLVQWITLGDWMALFRVQGRHHHQLTFPLETLWQLTNLLKNPNANSVPVFQELFVAAIVVLAISHDLLRQRSTDRPAIEATSNHLLILYLAVYWLFPLSLGRLVAFYRGDVALLPAVLLLRATSAAVLWWIIALAAFLAYEMAILYFQARLV